MQYTDTTDVSEWDGLEVYVSGDGGANYNLAYKKTGNQLKTIVPAQGGSFTATPGSANKMENRKNKLNALHHCR